MDVNIQTRVQVWLKEPFDAETQKKVAELLANDPAELNESFYRDLEFGTGGLRGVIGVGTNRMNIYTVAMATQGFSNYIKINAKKDAILSVAVAYDSRNYSPEFAKVTADVFAANGFKVYLFDKMRPTPLLSFAVRHFHCLAGVMITASHNPKEYNGYKAYWSDGAQLTFPHDENVIKEVQKIASLAEVKMTGGESNIQYVGEEVDRVYLDLVKALVLNPQAIKQQKDLKMVYTPLHGTGKDLVPKVLNEVGFENLYIVEEQSIPDGNFPTIKSPNPEEKAALEMAIEQAKKIGADLVMATDPDADRVGIAVRIPNGEYMLLTGNQTASVLVYYLISKWKALGRLNGNQYIVKTIVTSELLKCIADRNGVKSYDVLTGFKYIAEVLAAQEGKTEFIGGGEESYGYLVGDFVRDKDAVIACCLIAEMAADAACAGKTFLDILVDLYKEYGFYKEDLVSITKKGQAGIAEIKSQMTAYRQNPPKLINGSPVVMIKDYLVQESIDMESGQKTPILLPSADVLQFFTQDGSKITVRPSGTEPKIKFYFGVKAEWDASKTYEEQERAISSKIQAIKESLELVS